MGKGRKRRGIGRSMSKAGGGEWMGKEEGEKDHEEGKE